MTSVASISPTATPLHVTVCPTKYLPTPESDHWSRSDVATDAPLGAALTMQWLSDAHLSAYAPVVTADGIGPLRLASGALDEGVPVRMVMLIGDVDGPKHAASEEWRAETLPRLEASGLAYYATRGGYRVLAQLADPIDLTDPDDARDWRALYLGWVDQLQAEHGLRLDPSCADWTRLYRLPCVRREGVGDVSAPVVGDLPAVDWRRIAPRAADEGPSTAAPREAAEDRELTEAEEADLDKAAELIEPHFEHGTRNAMAVAIGGWLRNAGMPRSAAAHLIEQLPSDAPGKRVADAERAWMAVNPAGWSALESLLPAETMAELTALRVGPSFMRSMVDALGRAIDRTKAQRAAQPKKRKRRKPVTPWLARTLAAFSTGGGK